MDDRICVTTLFEVLLRLTESFRSVCFIRCVLVKHLGYSFLPQLEQKFWRVDIRVLAWYWVSIVLLMVNCPDWRAD